MSDFEHTPAEYRQHLKPMQAKELHETDAAFIFMDADLLEAERQAIEAALPASVGPYRQAPSQDESIDLAIGFSGLFQHGAEPQPDELRCALEILPWSKIEVLRTRLIQIRLAIRHARHYRGRDFDPTRVFAVPAVWRLRWESVISGDLLPAYVVHLDVGQYSVG